MYKAAKRRYTCIYFTWDAFGEVNVMKIVHEPLVKQ